MRFVNLMIAVTVCVFGNALPAVAGSHNIPPGSKIFGGIAFDAACKAFYGPKYVATLIKPDAYGWRCTPIVTLPGGKRRFIAIDTRRACEITLGIVGLHAAPLSDSDPGSWRCFDPPRKQ